MKIANLVSFLTITVLVVYFSAISSCTKEYSYEGFFVRDTIPPRDTTVIRDTTKIDSTLNLPLCNTCDSTKPLALNSWSLRNYNSYLCGVIDNSYFDPQKNTVTFWGPLNCTRDTGLRIVAFFQPLQFTTDHFNVSTSDPVFYLQDKINYMNPWNGNILRTDGTTPEYHTITVVVDTFINSTKLMVGRFYGYAYTKNNDKSYVDGKFRFIVQ